MQNEKKDKILTKNQAKRRVLLIIIVCALIWLCGFAFGFIMNVAYRSNNNAKGLNTNEIIKYNEGVDSLQGITNEIDDSYNLINMPYNTDLELDINRLPNSVNVDNYSLGLHTYKNYFWFQQNTLDLTNYTTNDKIELYFDITNIISGYDELYLNVMYLSMDDDIWNNFFNIDIIVNDTGSWSGYLSDFSWLTDYQSSFATINVYENLISFINDNIPVYLRLTINTHYMGNLYYMENPIIFSLYLGEDQGYEYCRHITPMLFYNEFNINYIDSLTSDLSNQLEQLQSQYNTLNNQYTTLQSQYNALNTSFQNLQSSYNTLQSQYNTLQSNYDTLSSANETLQSSYNTLQSNYDTLNTTYQSLVSEHASLQSSYDSLNNSYTQLNNSYQALLTTNTELQSNYDELLEEYENLQNDYFLGTSIYNPFYNATLSYYFTLEQSEPSRSITLSNDYLNNSMYIQPFELILTGLNSDDRYAYINDTQLGYFKLDFYKSLPVSNLLFTYITNGANDFNFSITFTFSDNTTWTYTNPQNSDVYKLFQVDFDSSDIDLSDKVVSSMTWRRQYSYVINTIATDSYYNGYVFGQEEGTRIGYNNGYNNGIVEGTNQANNTINTDSASYVNGYSVGYTEGANSSNSLAAMIWAVADIPFITFKQIFGFDILGINLANFVLGTITLLLVIYLIKKLL